MRICVNLHDTKRQVDRWCNVCFDILSLSARCLCDGAVSPNCDKWKKHLRISGSGIKVNQELDTETELNFHFGRKQAIFVRVRPRRNHIGEHNQIKTLSSECDWRQLSFNSTNYIRFTVRFIAHSFSDEDAFASIDAGTRSIRWSFALDTFPISTRTYTYTACDSLFRVTLPLLIVSSSETPKRRIYWKEMGRAEGRGAHLHKFNLFRWRAREHSIQLMIGRICPKSKNIYETKRNLFSLSATPLRNYNISTSIGICRPVRQFANTTFRENSIFE